jgi:hypothetical protein
MTYDHGDPCKTTADHDDYNTLDHIFGDTNGDGDDWDFNNSKDVKFIKEMQHHLNDSDDLLHGHA